jgi:hypothetical protein
VVALIFCHSANATSAPVGDDIPRLVSVSEVSKDGHVIHNRLTLDCAATDGSNRTAAKEITCLVVQQNIREPSPLPSKEEWDREWGKQAREMTSDELTKTCKGLGQETEEWREDAELRERGLRACAKKDNTAIVTTLGSLLRKSAERESQTCRMVTIPRRSTFTHVRAGVWVSVPDPFRVCDNVKVTDTIRRDQRSPDSWNYTEVTVATPSKDSFCQAETGTVEFTWRNAVTPYELTCRYLAM